MRPRAPATTQFFSFTSNSFGNACIFEISDHGEALCWVEWNLLLFGGIVRSEMMNMRQWSDLVYLLGFRLL